MVENAVVYFYLDDLASAARVAMLLERLSTQYQEVILTHMRKASTLTLRILKSLYPRADLDVAAEGFAATCIKDEANKLMEDSVVMLSRVMEMLPIDMS
jgi:hypothetical protein